MNSAIYLGKDSRGVNITDLVMKNVSEQLKRKFKERIKEVKDNYLETLFVFDNNKVLYVSNPRIITFGNIFLGFDWRWKSDENFSSCGFPFDKLVRDIEDKLKDKKFIAKISNMFDKNGYVIETYIDGKLDKFYPLVDFIKLDERITELKSMGYKQVEND